MNVNIRKVTNLPGKNSRVPNTIYFVMTSDKKAVIPYFVDEKADAYPFTVASLVENGGSEGGSGELGEVTEDDVISNTDYAEVLTNTYNES